MEGHALFDWQLRDTGVMRRGVAGLILGLSLVVASISWAGFIMSRTVLDPGRSERLAEQVFDNDELRSVLVNRLAESLAGALPNDVVVPSQTLEAAASVALDNPDVQQLVQTAIVDTHRSALEGDAQPVVIDSSVVSNALRMALIQANPNLEGVVPEVPATSVELPTTGLNFLGTLKGFVDQVTILAALVALAGGATALVISNNRPAILRRVAFWAFGASLFWLIVGYGVPYLAALIGPASSALITAAIDVFFGAMIRPAIIMGGVGIALLAASMIWSAVAVRRPARVAQPARAPRGTGAKTTANRIGAAGSPPPVEAYGRPVRDRQSDHTVVQTQPFADPSVAAGMPTAQPGPTASTVQPGHEAAGDGTAFAGSPARREPVWIEGRGYVEPGDPDHPDTASDRSDGRAP